MQNKAFAIVNAMMALSYSVIGILLIIYPESNFAQMMLPSYKWAYALGTLLVELSTVPDAIDMKALGVLLCNRLTTYPRGRQIVHQDEQVVLTGYLVLLEKLIRLNPTVIPKEAFHGNLVKTFLSEFLFTMPTDDVQDKSPICDNETTKQAAFGILSAYVAIAYEPFEDTLQEVGDVLTHYYI